MELELIYCCELTDLSPNSETATEFLSIFDYDFSSYIDTEKKTAKHIVYFDNRESADLAAANLAKIPDEWQDTGLKFADIKVFSIEKKDWSEVWKKHFTIQHVTDNLTIKPSWLEYTKKTDDEVIIEIDPGMSFGTGRHATTRFCLKMLAEIQKTGTRTCLDAGCGSGILTIAAFKMGFSGITAFDYDADCIRCTKENLNENNIDTTEIDIQQTDITELSFTDNKFGTFDVVIANIMANILYDNRQTIKSFLKPDSYLILAGILTEEYPKIRDAYIELGFRELKNLTEDEWTGGFFTNQK